MRVSLNWLKEYVNVEASPEDLAHQFTMLGLEIEKIESPGAEIEGVVIGQILEIAQHPDADKIVVCKTDTGGPEPLQICCGASRSCYWIWRPPASCNNPCLKLNFAVH